MSMSVMGVRTRLQRQTHSVVIKPAREEHARPCLLCAGAVAGAVPEVEVLPWENAQVLAFDNH